MDEMPEFEYESVTNGVMLEISMVTNSGLSIPLEIEVPDGLTKEELRVYTLGAQAGIHIILENAGMKVRNLGWDDSALNGI